jgi:signal peptidase II
VAQMGTTTPGEPAAGGPAGPAGQDSGETATPTTEAEVPGTTEQPGVRRARPAAVATLAVVAAVVLAGDAIAKYFVVDRLTDHPPVRTLGGLIYLDLFRNSGAAFSMLSNRTWVFTVVASVAVAWICWLAARLRSFLWAVALGLVLGGALGNLTDRVFREPGFLVGHVVDYISLFGPNGEHFAIFNLADAMLCVGVGLAIVLELAGLRRDGTRVARHSGERAKQAADQQR